MSELGTLLILASDWGAKSTDREWSVSLVGGHYVMCTVYNLVMVGT